MFRLFFEGFSPESSFSTELSEAFCIDADSITDSNGQTIAVRQDGFWKAGANPYVRIECDGPIEVMFADSGEATAVASGSYGHMTIISGMIRGGNEYVALLDKHGQWLDYQTHESWSAVVLSAA